MTSFRSAAAALAALSLFVVGSIAVRGADKTAWQALADAAVEAESEGRLEEAETMLLAARREARGPDAARMLQALSVENLADFYYRCGRLAEAEPLYLQSLDLWAEILGPQQPRVGIPMHNLAVLYLDDCRVDEALPLIDDVLKLWESALGPDHPDRIAAIRTEATLLRRCGREVEAAALQSHGPAHPQ
jgi:tetratricopeptide (TPR) repeat protein